MPGPLDYFCRMKKLRGQGILMIVTILGIAGFLSYWLKQSYDREKRVLSVNTGKYFRETMQNLQVANLELEGLPSFPVDSMHGKVKVFMTEDGGQKVNVQFVPKGEVVSRINVMRDKMRDSIHHRIQTMRKKGDTAGIQIISMDK